MKLQHYPYPTHLMENICKRMCSEQGGIISSLLVSPIKYAESLDLKSVAGQMPAYHRVLLDPKLNVQYHLSGYGTFYEEAIIRLVGEAIERYALMVSQYPLAKRFRYATYNQIRAEGEVIPWEYLHTYTPEDYARLCLGQYKGLAPLREDDVVGWIQCPSLFNPERLIWVPVQLLFVGYRVNLQARERAFCPGFSTGTAAHATVAKALSNALLECLEIDALMVNWYTKRPSPRVLIDDPCLLKVFGRLLGTDSDYEVMCLDLSLLQEVRAHCLGTVIMNKKEERPFIVYGAQGHLHPTKGLYRSLMEAMAIAFLGLYGPLYAPQEYLTYPDEGDSFTDLDRNVAFFAYPPEAEKKRKLIRSMAGEEKLLSSLVNYETADTSADLARLIRQLASVSQYAVFLDITPPEAKEKGWHVMRAFIPELLTMCVPGVPYRNHPRFRQYGGIRNEYPHPMP